jgi:hypothetical protein
MLSIAHYVLSFDSKGADVPSPLRFGMGFTSHSQPVVGDIVPMPDFQHEMLVFRYDLAHPFTVQTVVRHPCEIGDDLALAESFTTCMAEMKHLYAHLLTRRADVHCESYEEAIRCRDCAYDQLKDHAERRKNSGSKDGITYVLPPKPDPKPNRYQNIGVGRVSLSSPP